jgi:N-glycosylase/DNA lyase
MAETAKADTGLLEYPVGTLDLEYTLTNGQLFRWRKGNDGWWDVVTGNRAISMKVLSGEDQSTQRFEYRTYPHPTDRAFVERFFRVDVNLPDLYQSWEASDPYLGSLTRRFTGLRLVLQDPEECLLSFICSTANFIPRIMKAIATIAQNWGEPITRLDGSVFTHAFPRASVIAGLDPFELSEKTGLEWRAGNLVKVAAQLAAKPEGWLRNLSSLDYASARGELMRIDGVGPKIADCVCLFAMAKDQAVPVDTHVWQLTHEHYLPTLKGKSLTPSAYAQVVSFFQSHFEKAGWAQQYLFYDHLLASRARSGRR